MNEDQISKRIKSAWIAGVIAAIITFIYSLIGTYNDNVRHEYGLDVWSLLDVALIAGLTYGIYKKNRFCALGLLIYYVVSKFIQAASIGQFSGGLLSLLFAWFFLQGTIATFQLHKQHRENQELSEKSPKSIGFYIGIFLGSVGALIFILLMIIGVMSPETEVLPGQQIKKEYVDFVLDEGIIRKSERIHFWYSDAIVDFKEGFYFITDEKVVVYSNQWEEPAIIIPYNQIDSTHFYKDPSFLEDSRITLFLNDESTVYFPVSSEYDGDDKFYQKLIEIWESHNSDSVLTDSPGII